MFSEMKTKQGGSRVQNNTLNSLKEKKGGGLKQFLKKQTEIASLYYYNFYVKFF